MTACAFDQVATGEPGVNGGPAGDLFVEIHLKPHKIFQREGDDLHCELTVPFTTAALGGDIQVPTLSGKAEITIPEGTQSSKTFRLRGKGVKGVRAGYPGDLYCHVVVETPVRLTDPQKEILRQFEQSLGEGGDRHSPQSKSWTDRVKESFLSFLNSRPDPNRRYTEPEPPTKSHRPRRAPILADRGVCARPC